MESTDKEIYEKWLLKKYKHWGLYLHTAQYPYIGRCYAAAIRPDADLVTDMNQEERDELFGQIISEWKNAVNKIIPFDRENLAILGNDWQHLHAHLIPRRQNLVVYQNLDFLDPNPHGNYAPYEKQKVSDKVLEQIFSDISTELT